MFNVASDLQTHKLVWIRRSIRTDKQFEFEGNIHAMPSYQIAGMMSNYKGLQSR
jgi:hypothetical protein